MISQGTLTLVQDKLMDAMTMLYVEDRDDQFARVLASAMVQVYEAIDIEILERSLSASND